MYFLPWILYSYEGQSLVVNEIFPPIEYDSDSDVDSDDNARPNIDRSDASRTADEGVTTDDDVASENEFQFPIDDLKTSSVVITID